MKPLRYILFILFAGAYALAYAQTDTIRYVHPNGAYSNNGRSWDSPKNRVQDAINDLRDYLEQNGLHSGSVYIAAGTYTPTESTEGSSGSMLNTSFKIYAGIHVYGGFNPDDPEDKPGDRIMANGKKCSENWSDPSGIGTISGEEISSQWDLRHKTILTGNHSGSVVSFAFDSIRGRYNTAYPASSYHVVWFATNGKYTTSDEELKDHFKPLEYPASLDGCVISSGNASTRNTTTREHTAFGGGVYMVGNTSLRNCIVERCNASLRGGGIYADGGGIIEFCYIHTCQSVGIGVVQGYGGGVCIDQEGSIGHSQITSCAARCGGGLMISHVNTEYPWTERVTEAVLGAADTITSYYSPFATACVVNNNTANAEGGGIYLAEGGTVNHCTVTGNNCSGPDVTYYGRRHGRTGGIYVRNCGLMFNSVFWGNRCDANNDIQFASVRQSGSKETHEIFAYHTAFMNHDITDWTGVRKDKVFSLDRSNTPKKGSSANYPCFFNPTVDPNNWSHYDPANGIHGAGVLMHMRPVDYPGPRIWHLTSYSALDQKGVQWNETVHDASPWLIHAHTDYGVVTNPYEPVSTLGALVRKPDPIIYALVAQQGQEGRLSSTPIPTLFIDPNRKGVFDGDTFIEPEHEGNSWDSPIKEFGEAISYFRQYLVDDPGEQHHYWMPTYNADLTPTGDSARFDFVQILMKEGTVTTVGPGNYLDRNIRTAAVRLDSRMRLYGGYSSALTGTNTEGRNPRTYKSFITANITGKETASAYPNNSAHVIAMVNCEHSIVDGFTLNDANTHNVYLSQSAKAGGGLLLNNASVTQDKRINMVGNQLRNCVITNCSSPKGAAVYVNGEWPKADDEICYAELMMVNCVIRNNTADFTISGDDANNNGIVTANGRAYIHTEHCTMVNNVGFPFKSESKKTDADDPIVCPHPEHEGEDEIYRGYVRVDNSLIFCNTDRTLEDNTTIGDVATVQSVNPDGQEYIFGKYNMFDADLKLHKEDYTAPHGFFKDGYTVPQTDHFLPDGVTSHFTDDISNVPADSTERDNKAIFTRADNTASTFPVFVNPSRNVGHSITGDKPLYGGVVAYVPMTTNPCVNAAGRDDYTNYYDYDRSDVLKRDRGGAPDVGAIENDDLPEAGKVIYVTPEGRGKMDGSSWGNSIAGNLVYQIGGSYVVDAVNGDGTGNTVTTKNNLYRGGYAVDYVWHTGTTNYVDKQTVTQKRVNMTYYEDGTYKTEDGGSTPLAETTDEQTVTTSNTLTREKTAFIYGEKSGSSRNFYRTNLKDSQIATAKQSGNGNEGLDFQNAYSITNNREEDFVSGLQFAVEKAAELNKSKDSADRVQVWVGNGVYEDYKGYVMRDKVEVYGGFPATKFQAPSMSERQALVSTVIPLSSKSSVREEDKALYETILQISDKKPFDGDTWAFDTSVMLYKDKDYSESGTKTVTTTTSVTIPVYYRRDTIPAGGYTEYYEVPGGNVVADETGRILNPGFEKNTGAKVSKNKPDSWNKDKAKGGWPDITGLELGGSANHCAWIKNNGAIDFYQEIDNLEPGLYRISVQAFNKGKAKGNVKLVANGKERTLMDITTADDTKSAALNTYAGWFQSGKYSNNWVDVYIGESGHLRFGLKGEYTGTDGWTVFDNFKLERLSGEKDITSSTEITKDPGYVEKTQTKEYTTFRKPVLFMPDVCMSTYWPCTIDGNDDISNTRRHTYKQKTDGKYTVTPIAGTGYVLYENARWDGFTIRNGFYYDYFANRDGGGGVRMFENGSLAHCVVIDNTISWGMRTRGGGAYCDGWNSEVISCFFLNNLNSGIRNATPTSSNDKNSNGGGIYLLVGTCYNSLFANNVCWGKDPRGAGIYIEQATFYNNTVAYNTCRLQNKNVMTTNGTAVHQYNGDGGARLNVFNTIFYGNTGKAIGAVNEGLLTEFRNCYLQSPTEISNTVKGKFKESTLYNGVPADAANNPFEHGADAPTLNNYRLKDGSGCVNKGDIPSSFVGEFPSKDVDFANRIQDCQIDIGAYEYNAAYGIKPDTTTHPGHAIFYISFEAEGDASASSPFNAACKQKLQLVLDAAGRYKYNLMTLPRYKTVPPTPVADQPDSTWMVEVWMEGDSAGCKTSNEYKDKYTATRSTWHSDDTYQDNTLDYSFIVPHGVHVRGGYTKDFYHYEKDGAVVPAGTADASIVDERDPLTFRTVLSGDIVSSTGASGQTYHVVTFTNDLFNPETEKVIGDGNQLAAFTDERDRAVLDGLFITDGMANSPDAANQIGGGCVVTDYAHVRNCVVQNNTAMTYGGGLYLKPLALVSGTIIKNNTAETGGGVYIEAPSSELEEEVRNATVARVFSSTICDNSATASAGGLWFDNSFARINSSALWHNSANDNANIAGNFERANDTTAYPLNYCAVESRRLDGQGNIELSPQDHEGVRWDHQDPFDAILYYPIEMSSTLSRAGMNYPEWDKAQRYFTTLDTIDIAGVSRKRWTSDGSERGYAWGTDKLITKNNDAIEIGARAINKDFAVRVDEQYVMRRLYVMHTGLIDSEAARALQDNTETDDISNMYRQMGSCIYNPFHRLDDAFNYVIQARIQDSVKYRNVRFEIFVEQGTYYPAHDAHRRQGEVRMNTFLIPEAVLIVGGVDSRPANHKYGQEGFRSPFGGDGYVAIGDPSQKLIPIPGTSYRINYETTDSIRLRDADHRPMRDNNLNSVIEPWELERQTILSGNAVSGEDFTHVYHVVTCHADDRYVGPRPFKFRTMNDPDSASTPGKHILIDPIGNYDGDHWAEENDLSILGRTIGFDGLQITGGYAGHVDPTDTAEIYNQKTYFRGGGIFVDGTWSRYSGGTAPDITTPAKYNIPIVVENCVFTNNRAGNGGGIWSNGGIYMFGCHFTQNYSQGPMTETDQKFVPWSAGGCIAANSVCDISNTLFANNEARRGLYPLIVKTNDRIPDADARQGFGGAISASQHSQLRVVNCHFVRNKGVAYSSIYNFLANNQYADPDSKQYVFNTIFWGNEVFDIDRLSDLDHVVAPHDTTETAFATKYKASRAGVFHYDGSVWNRYEQLYHNYDSTYHYWAARNDTFNTAVIDTLMLLRAQGNEMEGMYFCSYRTGYGPTGMKPTQEGFLLTQAEQRAWADPRSRSTQLKENSHGDTVEDYENLWTQVSGNNNTIINRINTATDGPNFKQPSFVAGIDGYMQNADWLQARMNITTDQGWGYLKQTVTRGVSYYITKYTGTEQFDTEEKAWDAIKDIPGADREKDIYPIKGLPVAEFKPTGEQPAPGAMYNFLARRYGAYMSATNPPLPLGDQYYMHYTRTSSGSESSGIMHRISKNPKIGINDVYIDLGIYEYQYVQLDIKGQEIDTVWVATKAKDPIKQDGLSWETPTTDLQTAIDLLMSSHNNHDKYVCFMGDKEGGTFSPQNVLDNRRAFVITSGSLSPLLPDSAVADFDYGVNSLTFLGGYSFDVEDAKRDPMENPTVIEMPNTGNESQRNQLFVVEDMTRQMLQANFVGEYTSRDSVVIPIVFDGITFINPYSTKEPSESAYSSLGGSMSKKGGAAIYYRWQRRYVDDGTASGSPDFNMALHPDSALIDGAKVTLPKLTISNCIFMDNGKRTVDHAERSPAVRIDHGGGSSLIVNTLFHSNAGAPVYARTYDILTEENDLASVPNDVRIINCTSALNDGHIRLESDNSEVHNSLIWLDDLHNDTTIQLQMGASDQWDKADNKNRQGIDKRMTNNAVWGCFLPYEDVDDGDNFKNHPLATNNNDIQKGPGFVSPFVTATTSEQRRERSFRLNPSLRTHDKANDSIYRHHVFFRQYPNKDEGKPYWRRSNGFKALTVTSLAQDSDLAAKPRLSGNGMERGAYECLAVIQRVLYVDPNQSAHSDGDGSNWEKAFGQGQLQNAIDAAAVYTYLYQAKDLASRKAYVFVKSARNALDQYNLVARDGVSVYGSLPEAFGDTAVIDTVENERVYTNSECQRFVNYVRAVVPGVASPNTYPTKINSIRVTGDDFNTGFLLDGFLITNPGLHPTSSPILLDNTMTAMRNCIIANNTVSGHPIADIRRGLLYNCLFYNDSAQTIVKLGANGLALNNTIVADDASFMPLDASEAAEGAAQNNIALNTKLSTLNCFAPYLTSETPYTLPTYLTQNKQLAYQLHEHSAYINAGTAEASLPSLFDAYKADSTIAFRHDRDLLGNPRKIGSSVDKGALETWYVAKNQAQELTARTNTLLGQQERHDADDATREAAFTTHYGGHVYPHPGSVVYLMDSTAMTMQYAETPDFRDFSNHPIILRPGFMLLKPGASFYGNGYDVQLAYLAAEKRFINQRYAMTAFPFNYSMANLTTSTYDPENEVLHITPSTFNSQTYQYSGQARSAKDYVFRPTNSALWLPVDTLNRTATDGYLMDFGTNIDTVLRFNAFAPTNGQYVYTEDGNDKSIYLTQYDHRTAGSGASLDFTTQENMGWNMKGLPWLVSDYRTDTLLDEDNYYRQMYIPHVLYQMNGAGEYVTEGDKVITTRSWDRGATTSMGMAFFVQTATKQDREEVTFYLPRYGLNEKAARPFLRLLSRKPKASTAKRSVSPQDGLSSDIITFIPDSTAAKNVTYSYGRDGLKWILNDSSVNMYLMDSKRQSRIALLGAAPTEVDIPLGIYVPQNAGANDFSFGLPEKEAFADYTHVWLIDYELKTRTNLLGEDYTFKLPAGEHNNRFAIRIGGFRKVVQPAEQEKTYIVFATGGVLYVRDTESGDRISVYTASGQLIGTGIATGSEWTMPLPLQTSFIVRVNDSAYKVLNR